MTKEQLIALIKEQNQQIQKLTAKTNIETNFLPLYENCEYLSDTSMIGLIITGMDGSIISFNKTVRDLFDINMKELKGTKISELYADSNDRQKLLDMLAKTNTVRDFEVKVKHKNGTLRTVLANIDHITWNKEDVLLTSLYDITQYKKSHEVQKKHDQNYRTLFSNAPVGITVTDFQGNVIIGNNAIKELLGYSGNELSKISAWDFYSTPTDRQQLLELTKNIGNVRDFETTFNHKNGSKVNVLVNTDIIEFDEQKNVLLTSIRDISNLKHTEEQLIIERDFSNTLLNIAATLIIVVNKEGIIKRFNRTCEQLTGHTFEEMNGKYLWDLDFFEPKISHTAFQHFMDGNSIKTVENKLTSRDKTQTIISWTFAAMTNQDNAIDYVIATGLDITEQYQAKENLQHANMELSFRVKELQERTSQMNQLNEMGEQLQSCQTIEEACKISTQYIQRICPKSHGALYLIDESSENAEAAKMWGEPSFTKDVFQKLECWALRRGRQHLVDAEHPGLLCEHITGPESGQYLCVPLLVNGETIGILHLNHTEQSTEYQQQKIHFAYNENKVQIVTTIAEHIALALSNLKLRETLRQQSIRDALTGLFNRRYMQGTLEQELKHAERDGKTVGVIMIDIDHFKDFNDRFGHDAGDALLRALGSFLMQSTRDKDIACRYGGEEFLLVMPGIDLENARLRAEKLRQGVKGLSVSHLGNPLPKCTISLGVAIFPENGMTSESLLKTVDNALYRAKDEGRDRVALA
jgi:diguanylate cyclase (GGDEF)-like protein/PAS domain S-box-containing protein